MPNAGVGDRSGWKDRIEQSTWVDGARWVDDDDPDAPVEFLEAEPSAYRLSETQSEDKATFSTSPLARGLAIGAVGVVLIALAIMSRPGDEDPFSQLPTADQQQLLERQAQAEALLDEQLDEAGGADPESEDAAAVADGEPGDEAEEDSPTATAAESESLAAPRPIPELRADLPDDLPGVIFAYGPQDSVISIKRSEPQPLENPLGPGTSRAPSGMVKTSPSEVGVFDGERLYSLRAEGGIDSRALPDGELYPSDSGFLVVLEVDRAKSAFVLGDPPSQTDEEPQGIPIGNDLAVLGGWGDRALVHQASKVWLIDRAGGAELVTDGVVLGYDNGFLAMIRCDGPGSCRIEVGPPNQPSRRAVAMPENLTGRSVEVWAGTGAVSADGDRLALVDQRGAVQLPTWVDLVSGEDSTVSQSVDQGSPVAWSPDGRWLAYAIDDDILLWDTESGRDWRVSVARPLSHLAWLAEVEPSSESESETDSESESEPGSASEDVAGPGS